MVRDAENIFRSLLVSPFPNSYVINLLIEEDNEADMIVNIITTPPTTLEFM